MNYKEMEQKGLTEQEIQQRRAHYGLNELKEVGRIAPWKVLLRQIKNNFIIYLLAVAAILSFGVGKSVTAYTIVAVISLVIILGFIQEYRAEQAVASLRRMITPLSIVIRDGRQKEVPSSELVPGDIVILRNGERIPADCLLLEGIELRMNEAILTGESGEVTKRPAQHAQDRAPEAQLYMGTFIVNGRAIARVVNTGMTTKFGQIANLISTEEKELPLQKKLNRIAKYMASVAIIFSLLTGMVFLLRNTPITNEVFVEALIIVIALSVSAFPEGLPVVLITTLSSGAYRMAKKNAIVNRISIIETLGETTVICSDKTGTITKGEMTVKKVYAAGAIYEVGGSGYSADGAFSLNGKNINPSSNHALEMLCKTAVACNDASITHTGTGSDFSTLGTPTEVALLVMAAKGGFSVEHLDPQRKTEIPFNSERKMMSVLATVKGEDYVFTKGAPEIVLTRCNAIAKAEGVVPLTSKDKAHILDITRTFNEGAFRTLALAYKEIPSSLSKENFEEKCVFIGLAAMEDPPREEVAQALKTCAQAGIMVKMITGDNKETALSIARQIGLAQTILVGSQLDDLTDEELVTRVQETTIFARVRPEHKLRIISALKRNGEIVTMTGDGVNDAPALKASHIGVAMGKAGTDVSRAVADLTLKDDNFSTIVAAVAEGRTIFNNMRKFVAYQLSCNYAEIMIIFLGILIGLPLPLLAIQILFMNLVTDDIPAITLGLNPSSRDVMLKQPRRKSQIITRETISMVILTGTIMGLGTLGVFFYALESMNRSVEEARTLALVTLIFFEIANAFNFRSFRKTVLTRNPLANPYLVIASIISIIATVAIIYTPLSGAFETVPLMWSDWLLALIPSCMVLLLFDIFKKLNEKHAFWKDI